MPDGSFLRYQYDAAHRLTEIADGLGNVIQYTLDAMGNRIKEDVFDPADRLVRTQRRIYDALNRLYNDIGAAGQMSAYPYDGNGNLKTSTDPLNRSTALNYDALNRLLNSTDAGGRRHPVRLRCEGSPGVGAGSDQSHDDVHLRRARQSHAAGEPGHGHRDLRARCRRQRRRSDRCARAWRRATSTTRSIGRRWRRFAGGSVALEYDNTATGGAFARGRLTRITDPSGSTTYAYDAWGRVLRKTQTVGSDASARSFAVGYQYAAGRMTGITYPSGRV